jgi:hypothetical protein
MKQSEIVEKVKKAILLDIAVAEYHKSLISKFKWNPRKDGKPRAKFSDSLTDDPYIQAAVFAYSDGKGDFRFGFISIDRYTTNKAMFTDIFEKFNLYQIPNTAYIYKNFCPSRLVNGTMTPVRCSRNPRNCSTSSCRSSRRSSTSASPRPTKN